MVQRIKIGQQKDGKYGLRISKAGYDVDNVTDPKYNENLIFNSDWEGILPLLSNGTITNGQSVRHGLGFIPFVSAMVNIGGRGWEQYVSLNFSPSTYTKDSYSYYKRNQFNGTWYSTSDSHVFTPRPQQRYAYTTDRPGIDQCRVRVDATNLYFDCTSSAQCRYMIYNMKAF